MSKAQALGGGLPALLWQCAEFADGLSEYRHACRFTTHVYEWVSDPADASRTLLGEAVPAQVPVGMEFLGVPFSEPTLLRIVAGYESVARHRRPPTEFSAR